MAIDLIAQTGLSSLPVIYYLEQLFSAIESTKPDIDVYPKGVWYRTAGNKIIRALKRIAKNKETRDLCIDVIKKLMENGT
ncbi:hypothetical protein [Shewanella algae]|uniref:hypothetical protein n=1 Tax=Shewanella algae TaxID=38313 RepID=UPI0031F5C8A9